MTYFRGMIDPMQNLILIRGRVRTEEIKELKYNIDGTKCHILFSPGEKQYQYSSDNVVWLTKPQLLAPIDYILHAKGELLEGVTSICKYKTGENDYYYVQFGKSFTRTFLPGELSVTLVEKETPSIDSTFDYLAQLASLNPLKTTEGEPLLAKLYPNIDDLNQKSSLIPYLSAQSKIPFEAYYKPILFPFSTNASQQKAVRTALENQLSVIQGPPGTGKTQTILSLIANLLVEGKSILVVSNNNSATQNVLQKLEKEGLGFLVAPLGSSENRKKFIDQQKQNNSYPEEIAAWEDVETETGAFRGKLQSCNNQLNQLFTLQEYLAQRKQELQAVELEWKHYQQLLKDSTVTFMPWKRMPSSKELLAMWSQFQDFYSDDKRESDSLGKTILGKIVWYYRQLRARILYGNSGKELYSTNPMEVITHLAASFYQVKQIELQAEIGNLTQQLETKNALPLMDELRKLSMRMLRHKLFLRYSKQSVRPLFTALDMNRNPQTFLSEYPIVLSTTFSARNSLSSKVMYDYLIMDEASQVSIETGALALTCARHAVVVGDTMQLANIIGVSEKDSVAALFERSKLISGYDATKHSFLSSLCNVLGEIPQTLLREHYRCHPKIINFCNQKFYNGNLLVMTEDKGEIDVLSAIRTVVGNHERGHFNQREIDVIQHELLPKIVGPLEDIGVVTPYNKQVDALIESLDKEIEVATVHKYQGREKDVMSTVDDEITPFSDDPNLINVAVSRAKSQFHLVVSGNEQHSSKNINDLLGYINYHNFTITQSKIHSVFDYLYHHYDEARKAYLVGRKRVSEYDSENLTYALLEDILSSDKRLSHLKILSHTSLRMLLRDHTLLTEQERAYVMNPSTHVDFLIYNSISKQAVLAVETDGYHYHKEGTNQAKRDELKNHILALYDLPLARLNTTGSNETKRIKELLLGEYWDD